MSKYLAAGSSAWFLFASFLSVILDNGRNNFAFLSLLAVPVFILSIGSVISSNKKILSDPFHSERLRFTDALRSAPFMSLTAMSAAIYVGGSLKYSNLWDGFGVPHIVWFGAALMTFMAAVVTLPRQGASR